MASSTDPTMGGTLKDLLTSKKFLAAIAGVIVVFLAHFGLDMTEDQVTSIVGLIISYIVGQGIADAGKEAVKHQIKADN